MKRNVLLSSALALFVTAACSPSTPPACPAQSPAPPSSAQVSAQPPKNITISVIQTNDLHGHVRLLPFFGGFVHNLRKQRAQDGGGVLLVDAGDMFQGTVVSNETEGASVIRAYNALGYQATTIGNHEFDYGPVGTRAFASKPGDDPFGALKARAKQAHFPFLTANILDRATRLPVHWDNVSPTTVVTVDGVRIGLVGVGTMATLGTTLADNVKTLQMQPLAEAITKYASELRDKQHVSAVVVLAHAGGRCHRFLNPDDLSSCDNGEVFDVVRKLPHGLVDLVVAAHTHGGIAHRVAGIPVLESYAYGQDFGRVDLHVQGQPPHVVSTTIFPPQPICHDRHATAMTCNPGTYAGAPVRPDNAVAEVLAPDLQQAKKKVEQPLHVDLVGGPLRRSYDREGALGNFIADLMREARPDVDVAFMNGGGLRADLAAGPITYGRFYNVFPFDNRFAKGKLKASTVASLIASNAQKHGGTLYISGLRAKVSCRKGKVLVRLFRNNGRPVRDDAMLTVLASDYLVTSHTFKDAGIQASAFKIEDGLPIREELIHALEARTNKSVQAKSTALFDKKRPRISLSAKRPLTCSPSK